MALRLLHTSDWHLGHELHGVDRASEHRRFLEWLVARCEAERVDALLISGDVFDVSNPSAATLATWAGFLVGLWRRMPGVQVVAIGGNHDSVHRLEMNEPFHKALGRLHVLGATPRAAAAIDLDRAVVRIEGADESALIAAIPYLRPADLKATDLGEEPAAPVRRLVGEVMDGARARRRADEAIVVMGHLFVVGGAPSSSERTLVGGLGAVPADVYPPDVAYVALGHLHRPQAIGGAIRYSGSPIPLAFDEAQNIQEVVLVTLAGGTVAEARSIPVPRSRRLIRIPADGFAPLPAVVSALEALPPLATAYEDEAPLIEARVQLDQPEPGLHQRLASTVTAAQGRLIRVQVRNENGAALPESVATTTLVDLDPFLVFRKRWARQYPGEPPPELVEAYGSVLDEARALEDAS